MENKTLTIINYLIDKRINKLDEEQYGLNYLVELLGKVDHKNIMIGNETLTYYKANMYSAAEEISKTIEVLYEIQEMLEEKKP